MSNKTLRQQILEIVNRGESWIDKKSGIQYTEANIDQLPSEADFAEGNKEEAKLALSSLDAQLFKMLQEKEALLKAMGGDGSKLTLKLEDASTGAKVGEPEPQAESVSTEGKKTKK